MLCFIVVCDHCSCRECGCVENIGVVVCSSSCDRIVMNIGVVVCASCVSAGSPSCIAICCDFVIVSVIVKKLLL